MGQRGPIRDPTSVRGEREARHEAQLASVVGIDAIKHDTAGHIVTAKPSDGELICPGWLSPAAEDVWHTLVADTTTAGVVLRRADAHAVAMAAYSLGAIEELAIEGELVLASSSEAAAKAKAKYTIMQRTQIHQRNCEKWLDKIGATPVARARMGIRQAAAKELGTVAKLIAAKNARGA
jgi:phage terminase small subunit